MKKTLISIAMVLFVMLTTVCAEEDITIVIDGEKLITDWQPFIEDGTTLVPMRGIFEKLGADVNWDGDTETVTADKGDTKIVLGIGSDIMKKNDDDVELIKAAVIENDRTFVPLRAVSEAFGADVSWDGDTKTITIVTVKGTPVPTAIATAAPAPTVSPEPTPAIPTPQRVTSMSYNMLKLSSWVTPFKRNATFSGGFYGPIDEVKEIIEMYGEKAEYGIRISEDRNSLYSDKAMKAVSWDEDITRRSDDGYLTYNVDLNKNNIYLKPDTTYYYGAYLVKDGEERKGDKGSFKTLKETNTIKNLSADTENIESNNAVFSGGIKEQDYIDRRTVQVGIYFGDSEDNMEKIGDADYAIDDNSKFKYDIEGGSTYAVMKDRYNTPYIKNIKLQGMHVYTASAKDLGLSLKPNTEYFWKFYVIWDNEEYTSEVASFTTDIE